MTGCPVYGDSRTRVRARFARPGVTPCNRQTRHDPSGYPQRRPAKRLYLECHVKCDRGERRMVNGDDRTYRAGKLTIAWQPSGLIGRVSLDGEHWASVEWSEKRQAWCI